MMEWSLEKPHLYPSPWLQCNTQSSLWSGVSPSGLRAQDSEIPNLASLLTISSAIISRSDPNGGSTLALFFILDEKCCFSCCTCPAVILTHFLLISSPPSIYNCLSSMTTTLPLISLAFTVARSNLSTTIVASCAHILKWLPHFFG